MHSIKEMYIIDSIKFVSIVYMYMYKLFMDQFISIPTLQYHLFKPFDFISNYQLVSN